MSRVKEWRNSMSDRAGTPEPLFVLGAYTLLGGLDDRAKRQVLDELAAREVVQALECSIDEEQPLWAFDPRPESTDLVFTLVGGSVRRLAGDPEFGLASASRGGRSDAIAYARDALAEVRRANDRGGRPRVRAIELHSAPSGGDPGCFGDSLAEVAGWDWEGAQVVVEHCDAPGPGPTSKGFLHLRDEIAAIARADCGVRMVVNWGRSAIEGRSVLTPLAHAREVREAGLLEGIMFSGCSNRPDQRGGAWADFHLPVVDVDDPADGSLLDGSAIRATLEAAGTPRFVGVKVSLGPHAPIEARMSAVDRSMNELLAALASRAHA
jgi:hypothetical protein